MLSPLLKSRKEFRSKLIKGKEGENIKLVSN